MKYHFHIAKMAERVLLTDLESGKNILHISLEEFVELSKEYTRFLKELKEINK